MAVTLKNISDICKVDISTVSRALRNDLRVKAGTREFIRAKAAELGYTPNLAARNLVSGKTLNLWMLLSGLNSPVEYEPVQFLSKSLHVKGYELLITLYHADAAKFNHLLTQLSQHVADGAFIIPSIEYSAPAYLPLLKSGFPLVFIDRQPTFENCTTVTTANKTAIKEFLSECVRAGAEKFIIISDFDNSVTRLRNQGAVEFLSENNLPFVLLDCRQSPPASLLDGFSGRLALVASSGTSVQEYYHNFIAPMKKIPEIISASFDFAPPQQDYFEHVFVAVQNFELIADYAADLMLKKIQGDKTAKTIDIPLKKIIRVK